MAPAVTHTHALLLTGSPGVGKTTVIRRVAAELPGWHARGFTTEEIRVGGRRTGFGLETLDGRAETLAHVDLSYCQELWIEVS